MEQGERARSGWGQVGVGVVEGLRTREDNEREE
jgi:hypothetical protein